MCLVEREEERMTGKKYESQSRLCLTQKAAVPGGLGGLRPDGEHDGGQQGLPVSGE